MNGTVDHNGQLSLTLEKTDAVLEVSPLKILLTGQQTDDLRAILSVPIPDKPPVPLRRYDFLWAQMVMAFALGMGLLHRDAFSCLVFVFTIVGLGITEEVLNHWGKKRGRN